MKQVIARGRVLGNSNSEFARMLEGDVMLKHLPLNQACRLGLSKQLC